MALKTIANFTKVWLLLKIKLQMLVLLSSFCAVTISDAYKERE